MADTPLSHDVARILLYSSPQGEDIREEDKHPWGSESLLGQQKPLLRVWDCYSGSQPDTTSRMMSRLPHQNLDTEVARREYLTIHADHTIWKPTPFISFTTSATAAEKLVNFRSTKRGTQMITAINPTIRAAIGLPIIDMGVEMRYYGIPDPYGRGYEYYKNHYLCLWEVTAPEVVGHWEWCDLAGNSRWYEEIIGPTLEEHERSYFGKQERYGAFTMSAMMDALLDTHDGYFDQRTPSHIDGDTSSEELGPESDCYYSDSDDDVEENNAADDAIKIIEGDWD